MIMTQKGVTSLDAQRRTHRRSAYLEQCFLQTDTRGLSVKCINLSDGGICVAAAEFCVLKRGVSVTVFMQNFEPIDAIVRWVRGNVAGLGFTNSAEHHAQINALLQRLIEGGPARLSPQESTIDNKLPESLKDIFRSDASKPRKARAVVATPETSLSKKSATKRPNYTEPCAIITSKRTFRAQSINISEGGMCLKLRGLGKMQNGADIQIVLSGGFPPIDATLRWNKDREIGVQFEKSIKGHPVLRSLDDSPEP